MTYKLFSFFLILTIATSLSLACQVNLKARDVEVSIDTLKLAKNEPSSGTTASGLQYEIIKSGKGDPIGSGVMAEVHYTGSLLDGTKFDSSKDRNTPFTFPVGKGAVIRGWDEGVAAMRVGEIRKLTIPPELAYGDRGAGNIIPPGATLVFEVELLGRK